MIILIVMVTVMRSVGFLHCDLSLFQWFVFCFQEWQGSVCGCLLQYIFWVINTTICQQFNFLQPHWFIETLVTVTSQLVPFFAPVLSVIFLLPQPDHGTCSCTSFFHLVLASSWIQEMYSSVLTSQFFLVVNSSLVDLFGFYFFTRKRWN